MRIKYKTFEMSDDNSRLNLTIENNMVNKIDLTQSLSIKEFFQAVNDLQTEIQRHNINFIEKTKNEVKDILPVDVSVLAEAINTPEIASVVSSIVNDIKNQTNTLTVNSSQLVDHDIRINNQPVNQFNQSLTLDSRPQANTSFSIEKKNVISVDSLPVSNTPDNQTIEQKKTVRINGRDFEYTGKNYEHVANTDVNPMYAMALQSNDLIPSKF